MKQNILLKFGFLFLSIILISCNSKEKMILGTWIPLGPDGKKSTEMKIQFLDNNKVVAHSSYDSGRTKDSISYEIKNEGKLLVTKDKTGRIDELVIIELSGKNLTMCLKSDGKDTIRFVKE